MIIVSPDSSSVISRQGVLQPCPIAAGIAQGTDPRTPQNRNFTEGSYFAGSAIQPKSPTIVPARPVKAFRSSMGIRLALICTMLALAAVQAAAPPVLLESLVGRQVFPATNWWNQDISGRAGGRPLAHSSSIGSAAASPSNPTAVRRLHPDFGPPPYGIPYVVVAGDQARVPVVIRICGRERHRHTRAARLSDSRRGPHDTRTTSRADKPGGGTSGDRHLLVIDRDRWMSVRDVRDPLECDPRGDGRRARARSSIWPPTRAAPRAGRRPTLPASRFFPGSSATTRCRRAAEITHAFRVTTRDTNGYVWPASHEAGSTPPAPRRWARACG